MTFDVYLNVAVAGVMTGLVYGLMAQTLWYAPVWGWLLLVSSWARRAPFLWAVLPQAVRIGRASCRERVCHNV